VILRHHTSLSVWNKCWSVLMEIHRQWILLDIVQHCAVLPANNNVFVSHTGHLLHSPQLKQTPLRRVLPENPTGPQLVKKFSAFYGTQRFITACKSARHLSLS